MDKENQSVELGMQGPDFCLPSSNGGEVGLSDYRGQKNVILFFVREYH